jgi:hypothetical protein
LPLILAGKKDTDANAACPLSRNIEWHLLVESKESIKRVGVIDSARLLCISLDVAQSINKPKCEINYSDPFD